MGRKLYHKVRGLREVINIFKKTKKKVSTLSVVSKRTEDQEWLFDLFEMAQLLPSY